jgi:hypothetical protein
MPTTLHGTFIGHRKCCTQVGIPPDCTHGYSEYDYSLPFTLNLIAGDPNNCGMTPLVWKTSVNIVAQGFACNAPGQTCADLSMTITLQWDCNSLGRHCFYALIATGSPGCDAPNCARQSPPEFSGGLDEPIDSWACSPLYLFFDYLAGGSGSFSCFGIFDSWNKFQLAITA